MSVAITKAREFGFTTVSCASTGNLATAVAAHAARAGLQCYIFMPVLFGADHQIPIDVELGARLFRHLLAALPISYFQARRVGDLVARVRELENIRNFLTSSALMLVIDLFFTFVFLAVMFLYSPLLTAIVLAAFPFYVGIPTADDTFIPRTA